MLDEQVDEAADHDARAPGGEQDAEAGIRRAEALLRVDDLDRDHQREQHERERLADQQHTHRRAAPREAHAGGEPLAERLLLDVSAGEAARERQDDRDRQERRGVDQERGGNAELGDQQAGQCSAADRCDREPDVHQRVAFLEQPGRLQDGSDCPPRETAAGDGQRAVQKSEEQHERQEEVARSDQRQSREQRGFDHIDARKAAPHRHLIEPGRQYRRQQSGQEAGRNEERGRRRDGLGPVVDQDRQRDDPNGISELVDCV